MQSDNRLYAFDNLRAVMMWLGIVLHSADLHLASSAPLMWHDSQTTPVADALVGVIHAFRMPLFFVVAGFFVSLLVEKHGVRAMLSNRIRRILLPFVLFWPMLFVACVRLAMLYAEQRGTRVEGFLDLRVLPVLPDGTRVQTLHLWFLEILMGLCLLAGATFTVVTTLSMRTREQLQRAFEWFATRWWAFAPVALFLSIVSQRHPSGLLRATGQLQPSIAEWVFYCGFFTFGALLYRSRQRLLAHFQSRCWVFAAGGLVALLIAVAAQLSLMSGAMQSARPWLWVGVPYNAASWLWTCALLGVFGRYLGAQRATLRYMSGSSYWVYLVHLPVLVGVEFLVLDRRIPAEIKMVAGIAATSLICLASYHVLVRGRALGRLLGDSRRG